MSLPIQTLTLLHRNREVAAELDSGDPERRAFVVVLPLLSSVAESPEAWNGDRLREPSAVRGYEVRYLEHEARFTEEEWGFDYDLVLDAETTRIRRSFVDRPEELAAALSPWLDDPRRLRHANFLDDAVLVSSPITTYLDDPEARPHLDGPLSASRPPQPS